MIGCHQRHQQCVRAWRPPRSLSPRRYAKYLTNARQRAQAKIEDCFGEAKGEAGFDHNDQAAHPQVIYPRLRPHDSKRS